MITTLAITGAVIGFVSLVVAARERRKPTVPTMRITGLDPTVLNLMQIADDCTLQFSYNGRTFIMDVGR